MLSKNDYKSHCNILHSFYLLYKFFMKFQSYFLVTFSSFITLKSYLQPASKHLRKRTKKAPNKPQNSTRILLLKNTCRHINEI